MINIKIWASIALGSGTVLLLIGVLALTYVPNTITNQITKNVHLGFDSNGTYNLMTQRWIEPKYAMQLKVWMLSVTNVKEVMEQKAYPAFEEKGPYVFDEHRKKTKVSFMDNETRVLYRDVHTYYYNPNASCSNCSLDDVVTFPSIIFQMIVDVARSSAPMVRRLINLLLRVLKNKEKAFVSTTVGEALISGYSDPLIDEICNYTFTSELCKIVGVPLRIKFFENDTDDGEYLIDTGLEGSHKIGKVYAYNGQDEVPWWFSPQARMINGTDGELFPTGLSRHSTLPVFLGQLGRSLYMRYDSSSTLDGISFYRYVVPPEVYDYTREENKGFCNPLTPRYFDSHTQPEGCLPAGLFDIGRLKSGSPRIYISAAHFYKSSPLLYQNFTGFSFPSDKDQSHIDLEPYTGVVVDGYEAMQINIGMVSGGLSALDGMRDMIVPVLWMNEVATLDEDTKKDLQKIASPTRIAFILGIIALCFGILLWATFLALSVLHFYRQRRADDEERLIDETDES